MKIGIYVRQTLRESYAQGLISEKLIINLQDPKWCKNNLLTNTVVLIHQDADPLDNRGHRRYYAQELFCGEYQLSSQWVEHQREALNYVLGVVETQEQPVSVEPTTQVVVETPTSSDCKVANFAQSVDERAVREELLDCYYDEFIEKFSAKAGTRFDTGRDMIDYFEDAIPSWRFHSIDNARNAAAHRLPNSKDLMIIGIVMIKTALNELKLI